MKERGDEKFFRSGGVGRSVPAVVGLNGEGVSLCRHVGFMIERADGLPVADFLREGGGDSGICVKEFVSLCVRSATVP